MKARAFDRKFDSGEDVTNDLDLSRARRPAQEQRRVNVDFPVWMIDSLDREARRLGVPRQSLIKMLVADHIESLGIIKTLAKFHKDFIRGRVDNSNIASKISGITS